MTKVSLVLSDVDGTLVTSDKRLTVASRRAVSRLAEHNIDFTITSSRPPFGLRMLVEPLGLKLPIGAFNGGSIVTPDFIPIEQHFVPTGAAHCAIEILASFGIGIWAFASGAWLLMDTAGEYVDWERRTIQAEPQVVLSFDAYLDRASKIVGVSRDFERLVACETAMQAALGASASIQRSQPYYLDVTPPDVDKGTVVEALSRRLQIPRDQIATIGDMDNDVAMFRKSGLSIAMGNASEAAKRHAQAQTVSNDEDGFAAAVEHLILQGAS